jgi:alkylation response protein AidB-like acyl-CoA dehydrogenase
MSSCRWRTASAKRGTASRSRSRRSTGRIGIAAQAVGIATEALEAAIAYAKQRRAFGKPIADFQVIRFYLADMATELDAARLLTRRAAAAKDTANRTGGRYGLEAAIAKLYAAEMAQRVTTKALQIHGGTATRRNILSSGISGTRASRRSTRERARSTV